jgi:type II secretory pathway component GspD/PulD (secretin)
VVQIRDPALPPPRQENSLSSIATVPDGFAVAVGGLELETESDTVSKVPLLGDIPWLGALFQNRSQTRSKSRFFVFLRCSVMRGTTFEELRYLSDVDLAAAGIDDGLPELEPRIIR